MIYVVLFSSKFFVLLPRALTTFYFRIIRNPLSMQAHHLSPIMRKVKTKKVGSPT